MEKRSKSCQKPKPAGFVGLKISKISPRAKHNHARSFTWSPKGSLILHGIRIKEAGITSVDDCPADCYNSYESADNGIEYSASTLLRLEQLGQGAGGVVYKAIHLETLKLVAVKEIQIHDRSRRHQLAAELRAMHKIMKKMSIDNRPGANAQSYQHLVQFYNAYASSRDSKVCIIMEYLSGGSLQNLIDLKGAVDEGLLKQIAADALQGIAYIHSKTYIHRDIKPANFLVDMSGRVKVSDFGLTKNIGVMRQSSVCPLNRGSSKRIDQEGQHQDVQERLEAGKGCQQGTSGRNSPTMNSRSEPIKKAANLSPSVRPLERIDSFVRLASASQKTNSPLPSEKKSQNVQLKSRISTISSRADCMSTLGSTISLEQEDSWDGGVGPIPPMRDEMKGGSADFFDQLEEERKQMHSKGTGSFLGPHGNSGGRIFSSESQYVKAPLSLCISIPVKQPSFKFSGDVNTLIARPEDPSMEFLVCTGSNNPSNLADAPTPTRFLIPSARHNDSNKKAMEDITIKHVDTSDSDEDSQGSQKKTCAFAVPGLLPVTNRPNDLKRVPKNNNHMRTTTFCGTQSYMSPERLEGAQYSFASDVWSFGLSILACACGGHPLKLGLSSKLGYWEARKIYSAEGNTPKSRDISGCQLSVLDIALAAHPLVTLSEECKSFLNRCLQRNPDARATCEELLQHPFLKNSTIKNCGSPYAQALGRQQNGSSIITAASSVTLDNSVNFPSNDCSGEEHKKDKKKSPSHSLAFGAASSACPNNSGYFSDITSDRQAHRRKTTMVSDLEIQASMRSCYGGCASLKASKAPSIPTIPELFSANSSPDNESRKETSERKQPALQHTSNAQKPKSGEGGFSSATAPVSLPTIRVQDPIGEAKEIASKVVEHYITNLKILLKERALDAAPKQQNNKTLQRQRSRSLGEKHQFCWENRLKLPLPDSAFITLGDQLSLCWMVIKEIFEQEWELMVDIHELIYFKRK